MAGRLDGDPARSRRSPIPQRARMSSKPEPESRPTAPVLRRFEAEFLRPYRGAIALGLLGLLLQSVLLLPVPLLQGWVVDRLVAYCRASASGSSAVAAV